jgi:hypothetical protein
MRSSTAACVPWLALGSSLPLLLGCPGERPRFGFEGAGGASSSSGAAGASAGGCPAGAAVCARNAAGIECGSSDGSSFGTVDAWSADFSDDALWTSEERYRTLQFPDVNGDGFFDACGRTGAGIECAVADGSRFGPLASWEPSYSAAGWTSPEHYYTIQFPDVNGDGRDDLCARGNAGIICSLSNGGAFVGQKAWTAEFGDAGVWDESPMYYATIQFADLNGDGRDDVCGRHVDGIRCALSDGATFTAASLWCNGYRDDTGNGTGWTSPAYYTSVRLADVTGDGKADVCGRSGLGISCFASNGLAFSNGYYWENHFSDANGWDTAPEYYATIQFPDVNGDGRADVCGRFIDGIHCALSTGGSFGFATSWSASFRDDAGWNIPARYRTIQFPDLNGDGMADVCGRGQSGVVCGLSDGAAFTIAEGWDSHFSDASGWAPESYGGTLQFPLARPAGCPAEGLPTPRLLTVQRFGVP